MWFDSYSYVRNKYKKTGYQTDLSLIKRGILLDTAPLFILIVGHYDKINGTKFVQKFKSKERKIKELSSYMTHDYDYLLAFLNSFGLGTFKLVITPHILTEFIKHLWKIVDNSDTFRNILESCFKTKWYLEDSDHINYLKFIDEDDFLKKELEVGDISITILAKDKKNKYVTVLTDDRPFAIIANKKYKFLTIYYHEVRQATYDLNPKNIPPKLLKEPSPQIF